MSHGSDSKAVDFEGLGVFYLGRRVDPETRETTEEPLLYDSRDLTTHAVCVGMTGSGKTGLCLSLLEEAALDGVPALAIDPKGDVGNLLLTFPDLAPGDFEPWVDPGEARRKDRSVPEHAAAQAELWTKGLASWGQDGERIRRLREAADVRIYTPGSDAGIPVSILSSFAAPPAEVAGDEDLFLDRVTTVATSILALLGRSADPVQDREHILLSRILDHAWRAGRDLGLESLIRSVTEPPFDKVGVMGLESFFPAKDRMDLAMALNNLLASPGFAPWLEGVPLDLDRLLYTADGKPRIAVLSIAHLSEAERMFFVTLLFAQTLAWIRRSAGTTSLRALLYMDEVFGYLPPVAEPPSKRPLLTLLKQARAYGLGLVLATQNPADLDYKALSNAGTWFLGRLQTERDRKRVVEGLVGASSGGMDRQELEKILGSLDSRVFLLQNVHEDGPVLFHTRWAMSYLAGPLTRQQISRLMEGVEASPEVSGTSVSAAELKAYEAPPKVPGTSPEVSGTSRGSNRPLLEEDVPERFLAADPGAEVTVYRPRLLGLARVHYLGRKEGIETDERIAWAADFDDTVSGTDWRRAEALGVTGDDLVSEPRTDSVRYLDLPAVAADADSYRTWEKDLSEVLYRDQRLELPRSPLLDQVARPGETERQFRARIAPLYREERDRRLAEVEERFASQLERLETKIDRARERYEREAGQVSDKRRESWISTAAAIGSALFGGGKIASRGNIGRATSAVKGFGRVSKEQREAEAAQETLEDLVAERDSQVAERHEEILRVRDELADEERSEVFETVTLAPRRTDVRVEWVGLLWESVARG